MDARHARKVGPAKRAPGFQVRVWAWLDVEAFFGAGGRASRYPADRLSESVVAGCQGHARSGQYTKPKRQKEYESVAASPAAWQRGDGRCHLSRCEERS